MMPKTLALIERNGKWGVPVFSMQSASTTAKVIRNLQSSHSKCLPSVGWQRFPCKSICLQRSHHLRAGRSLPSILAISSSEDFLEVPPEMVQLANLLADEAASITTKYFRMPLEVESKGDTSPVTIADRQAEERMRGLINKTFPEHSVFGEEGGLQMKGEEYVWVLDPIDGTKSFITGKPVFGTLIALVRNGTPILGIIDQPITKERWVGVKGKKSTLNGAEISTRQCSDLGSAYMYSTTPLMFEGENLSAYNRLAGKVRIPLYGCDCYAYGLLSSGFCDLVVEADMKPYDFMALVPVVEGAGGVFTNWAGESVKFDVNLMKKQGVVATEVLAACDISTHVAALSFLKNK